MQLVVKVGDIDRKATPSGKLTVCKHQTYNWREIKASLLPTSKCNHRTYTHNTVAVRFLPWAARLIITLQEPFMSMMTIDPHAVAIAKATGQPISAEVATLPDGSPRYATVEIGARATVEFAGLRAQDRDLVKYSEVDEPRCRGGEGGVRGARVSQHCGHYGITALQRQDTNSPIQHHRKSRRRAAETGTENGTQAVEIPSSETRMRYSRSATRPPRKTAARSRLGDGAANRPPLALPLPAKARGEGKNGARYRPPETSRTAPVT